MDQTDSGVELGAVDGPQEAADGSSGFHHLMRWHRHRRHIQIPIDPQIPHLRLEPAVRGDLFALPKDGEDEPQCC